MRKMKKEQTDIENSECLKRISKKEEAEKQSEEREVENEKKEEMNLNDNKETLDDEILNQYDIFADAYPFIDDFEYIDSDESTSSKNLDDSKKKNVLSMIVQNIINIYPNNERNREFKKYKEKKLEEKKLKLQQAEQEKLAKKQQKYEEKRKQKLEIYKVEKGKKLLVEKKKYSQSNIEHDYLMMKNYFEFLQNSGQETDICVSFNNSYISPMRLYFLMNIQVDHIHYLDFSRKWLSDNYTPMILELCIKKKVKCLNLSFNRLTVLSVSLLATFLSGNNHLLRIDLESNDLTNNEKDTDAMNTLFKSLENNCILKSLNVANTNLDRKNGEALCQLLQVNKTITEVNMEDNNFTQPQYLSIINNVYRNIEIEHKQNELRITERERMEQEEKYMHTYLMALEASIVEIENRERRKCLNKKMYINMWRKEMQEAKIKEQEIIDDLEKKHQQRIKVAEKKKMKQKKKK